jgi:hypothetical protein
MLFSNDSIKMPSTNRHTLLDLLLESCDVVTPGTLLGYKKVQLIKSC